MKRYYPRLDQFKRLAEQGNTVPVYCQLLSDNLTPVTAYASLAAESDHCFLLESVVGGENIARYSFLGTEPRVIFEARGHTVRITGPDGVEEKQLADPLAELEEIIKPYQPVHIAGLPRFIGGLVGYAGYDMIRYYERLPGAPKDDRNLPDLLFGLYETMVVFDHVYKTIKVVANARTDQGHLEDVYDQAIGRIERIVESLAHPQLTTVGRIAPEGGPTLPFASNFAPGQFEQAVTRCKEYIRAGDIFQVVLSQRLEVDISSDPFDIYRALRVVNPSPFMFHLRTPSCTLVGASPEVMCRVEEGIVTNRPLAGTRRRGRTEAEDLALAEELRADPKERAEHIMLVDLGRNDVGRVAAPGTIKLDDVMTIERYSHVMHICSNVRGQLADGKSAFDALRAALPVGTVSGAPKVRAMEIIDEFEPTRRGPYAGAVGYVDFSGNMDTCIALRTLVVQGAKAYVQVGAGIVADSVPETEYEETINKAKGLLRAIEISEAGFGS